MSVSRIIDTLEINARTPVPQNVVYSIRGWASQAGLLYLNKKLLVRCDDPDTLTKFVQDPGVRSYVRDVIDDSTVQLKSGTSASRMRSLLRDLDYLIELE
jgi:membrane-bound inhibitor of C-type lysozyme